MRFSGRVLLRNEADHKHSAAGWVGGELRGGEGVGRARDKLTRHCGGNDLWEVVQAKKKKVQQKNRRDWVVAKKKGETTEFNVCLFSPNYVFF